MRRVVVRALVPAALALVLGAAGGAPVDRALPASAAPSAPPASGCPTGDGGRTVGGSTTGDSTTGGTGRFGTGTVLGALPGSVAAPVGPKVEGQARLVSANLPNRTSNAGFALSMRRIAAASPDFITLNEVSRHSDSSLGSSAPGYSFYRDPVPDTTAGGRPQSMENAVLWRSSRWHLLDGGRVKTTDNDAGYYFGRPYLWDRYATWTVLQRTDGAVVSVISTHMMINPVRNPKHHGGPSRLQQYEHALQVLKALITELSAYGPVLVGGDMNSHAGEGGWTAASVMRAAGYGYTSDGILMFQFFPPGVTTLGHGRIPVVSDHPALSTTFDMGGVAGSGPTPPSGTTTAPRPQPARLPSGEPLTAQMVSNASVLIARGRAAKLPQEAWEDAIAAALVESGLRTRGASGGGVGLFDMRPGPGWGSARSLAEPERAADAFFGTTHRGARRGLRALPWRALPLAEADGAVLGSVFPEKFAARAVDAHFIADYLLTGGTVCSGGGLGDCPPALDAKVSGAISPSGEEAVRCLRAAFPALRTYVAEGTRQYCDHERLVSGLDIPLPPVGGSVGSPQAQAMGAAAAHYLQAHADELGVVLLVFGGRTWSSDQPDAGWRPYTSMDGATDDRSLVRDRVYVSLRGGSC